MPEIPCLPVEIIENILSAAWSSSLSVDQRITLMTSSPLVNKAWMATFTRVSSKDVHIPCTSYADQYLRVLREESPIYDEPTQRLFDLCRSITFHVENCPDAASMPVPLPNDSRNMAQALSTTLYAIHTLSYLPNLRRVTVDFFNWEFDDIFDSYRLLTVPNQVTELELNYAYSKCTPSWLLGAWRSTQNRHGRLSWSMSSIRTLSIFGAGETFVAEVASICPNLKTLVMDVHTPLADILNLPSSAKTNSSCISPAHVGVEVRGHQSRDYLPHIWDTSSSAPRTILS